MMTQIPDGPIRKLSSNGEEEFTASEVRVEFTSREKKVYTGSRFSSGAPDYTTSALYKALEDLKLTLESIPGERKQLQIIQALYRLALPPEDQDLGLVISDEASGLLTCALSACTIESGCLKANFSVRYPVTADPEIIFCELKKFLDEQEFTYRTVNYLVPNYIPVEHPLIQTLVEQYNQATGNHTQAYSAPGATYSRRLPLAAAYGMDNISIPKPFGPGRGYCHQPDECQHLPSLWIGAEVYLKAILALDRFDFSSLSACYKDLTITNETQF